IGERRDYLCHLAVEPFRKFLQQSKHADVLVLHIDRKGENGSEPRALQRCKMPGQVPGLIAALIQYTLYLLMVQVFDNISGLLFHYVVGIELSLFAVDLQPGSISKYRAYRGFEQNVIDTFFTLLGLNRLTDPLKIYHLFQLLLE